MECWWAWWAIQWLLCIERTLEVFAHSCSCWQSCYKGWLSFWTTSSHIDIRHYSWLRLWPSRYKPNLNDWNQSDNRNVHTAQVSSGHGWSLASAQRRTFSCKNVSDLFSPFWIFFLIKSLDSIWILQLILYLYQNKKLPDYSTRKTKFNYLCITIFNITDLYHNQISMCGYMSKGREIRFLLYSYFYYYLFLMLFWGLTC